MLDRVVGMNAKRDPVRRNQEQVGRRQCFASVSPARVG